jgi:phytoene synthase
MRSNFDHCAALVREADHDRYLATLFAPAEYRDAIYALYAFNIEIVRVRDLAREPMPGEIRLQWWREVLAGERDGEAAAHPVAAALRETMRRYGIDAARLTALTDAHAFDLYDEPMASLDDLDRYGADTQGAIFDVAGKILTYSPLIPAKAGIQSGESEDCDPGSPLPAPPKRSLFGFAAASARGRVELMVRHAGLAHAIAGMLARLGPHAARRQLYLPLEVLERHGIEPADIFARTATPGLHAALAELHRHAWRQLAAAQAELDRVDRRILPALLPVALAGPQLRRMEQRGYDPFTFEPLSAWRRQWLIWRAARDPRRIFR